MNQICLYDIIRDEKERPVLIDIGSFNVSDLDYDEEFIVRLISDVLHLNIMENEHLYVVAIDSDYRVSGIYNVSIGNKSEVQINTRAILLFLSLIGANGFISLHNHPNNVVEASADDVVVDTSLNSLANLLNIQYLGSYLLGRTQYLKIGTTSVKDIETIN